MKNAGLIWRTVKHLTNRQILHQIWHRLRRSPRLYSSGSVPVPQFLAAIDPDKPVSRQGASFTFLNQRVEFSGSIDWNYPNYGKLWTYQLNYFDFLNQPDVTLDEGLDLIRDFITQTDKLRDGLEPYPTSLRLINWIQFLSRFQVVDKQIDKHLFAQTRLLSRRLEYHLAGNHLLENGFALLVGATYFRHYRWFQKASGLIRTELETQILADGCHDERSPMYHQILLDRLLTILLLTQSDTWHGDSTLLSYLCKKAAQMACWLERNTFRNGDVPLVNDAAFNFAPPTAQIKAKADQLNLRYHFGKAIAASVSGYRMFRQKRYELFVDAGAIGPDHQPGHAHADTFSFVLYMDNQPFIVDNGTSTYQIGQRRNWERSTAAHNTVEVNEKDSSKVWAGFRVGRRANVTVLTDGETVLAAQHDGYKHIGIVHERSWFVQPNKLIIRDRLICEKHVKPRGIARFFFHSDRRVKILQTEVVVGAVHLSFEAVTKEEICVKEYALAEGFNQLRRAQCLEIPFTNTLQTTLIFPDDNSVPDLQF